MSNVRVINTPVLANKYLDGIAMPKVISNVRNALLGAKIQDVGYFIEAATPYEEAMPWPYILLDNGVTLIIQRDDEGNRPGSVHVIGRGKAGILCQCNLSVDGILQAEKLSGS